MQRRIYVCMCSHRFYLRDEYKIVSNWMSAAKLVPAEYNRNYQKSCNLFCCQGFRPTRSVCPPAYCLPNQHSTNSVRRLCGVDNRRWHGSPLIIWWIGPLSSGWLWNGPVHLRFSLILAKQFQTISLWLVWFKHNGSQSLIFYVCVSKNQFIIAHSSHANRS